MKTLQQFAQGDVLFTALNALPKDRQPRGQLKQVMARGRNYVFAIGEATGHDHTAATTGCVLNLDEGGVMWLTVEELTEVKHQEHGSLVLEPGTYRVDRQRELDAWEGWHAVRD